MKKIRALTVALTAISAIFSLLSITFALDFSSIAFAVSAASTAALFLLQKSFFNGEFSAFRFSALRKFLEYQPFLLLAAFVFRHTGKSAVPYALDLVSVIFWTADFALSLFILNRINAKNIAKSCPEIAEEIQSAAAKKKQSPKLRGVKWIFREVCEWLDAFVQAALLVSLVNIFVFQLYEIPSESMVPEFLVGDRVIVFKTAAGPKFPVSKVSLPRIKTYRRGDVVVFRNPHYKKDQASEIRTFGAQLLYMLTLTLVNANIDENGAMKYDPLVKRVCGVEGEQLAMVDGELYSRTAKSVAFAKVEEPWAKWNLNGLDKKTLKSVRDIPLSDDAFEAMTRTEKKRRELDLAKAKAEAQDLARQFASLRKKILAESKKAAPTSDFKTENIAFWRFLTGLDEITRQMIFSQDDGLFERFAAGWATFADEDFSQDPYAEALFRYNAMAKLLAAKLTVMTAQAICERTSVADLRENADFKSLLEDSYDLNLTICLLDGRAMPVFPPNDGENPTFIPKNNFFMMGDNRFNSLDMRHSYEKKTVALTEFDEMPFHFDSSVEPQYVDAADILGAAAFRFWPLNRAGVPSKRQNVQNSQKN